MKTRVSQLNRATSSTRSAMPTRDDVAPANWLGFDSGLQLVALALTALTLFVASYLFSDFWVVTHDPSSQSLWSALAAVAALLLALSPRSQTAKPSRAMWLVLAFFAWCVLSSVTTIYWHDTILELSRILTGAMWFLVLRELLTANNPTQRVLERRQMVLIGALVLGLGVVCALSITSFSQTRYPRQQGTFFNSNLFANACAMVLPLSLSSVFLLRRIKKTSMFIGVFLCMTVFVGLLVTSSKGGLLSAICALFWCAVVFLRAQSGRLKVLFAQHRVLVVVGATLLIVAVGAVAMQTVVPRILNARGDDNSTLFRFYTWQSTAQMALSRPIFGWGVGSFPHVHSQFAVVGTTQTSHQLWLQIAAENGVLAMLLLLLSCALFLRRAWKLSSTRCWPIALGAGGAIIAFMVHGLTDAGWSISSIVFILMLAFALLESHHPENANIEYSLSQSESRSDSRLRYSWLVVALLMGAASYFAQRVASGENAREISKQMARQGAASLALDSAREATQIDPLSSRAWSWLGVVQRGIGDEFGSEDSFTRAAILNPQSTTPWRSWANNRGAGNITKSASSTVELWNLAVQNAPRETAIRLQRARFLLAKNVNDATAIADLQTIVRARDEPYGRYPALADFVNLDFARASLPLAQHELQKGNRQRVVELATRSLSEITLARTKIEGQRATSQYIDNEDLQPPTDLDELQTQFEILKKKAQS